MDCSIPSIKILVEALVIEQSRQYGSSLPKLDPSCDNVLKRICNVLDGKFASNKHIMFSYAWKKKKDLVEKLQVALIERDFDIWRDETGSTILPGAALEEKAYILTESINHANIVVCFLSKEYVESSACMKELTYASNKSKRDLKVLLIRIDEDFDLPDEITFITSDSIYVNLLNESDILPVANELVNKFKSIALGSALGRTGSEITVPTQSSGGIGAPPSAIIAPPLPPSNASPTLRQLQDMVISELGLDPKLNVADVCNQAAEALNIVDQCNGCSSFKEKLILILKTAG